MGRISSAVEIPDRRRRNGGYSPDSRSYPWRNRSCSPSPIHRGGPSRSVRFSRSRSPTGNGHNRYRRSSPDYSYPSIKGTRNSGERRNYSYDNRKTSHLDRDNRNEQHVESDSDEELKGLPYEEYHRLKHQKLRKSLKNCIWNCTRSPPRGPDENSDADADPEEDFGGEDEKHSKVLKAEVKKPRERVNLNWMFLHLNPMILGRGRVGNLSLGRKAEDLHRYLRVEANPHQNADEQAGNWSWKEGETKEARSALLEKGKGEISATAKRFNLRIKEIIAEDEGGANVCATRERELIHIRELGGQDADREDEGDRNGARATRRIPAQANRNIPAEGNGEDAGGAQVIAGAGQLIRRNAENVAARLEMQAARLEAQVEQMFDGLHDADGAEDVPFDELVGMQGPVFHLVENAFTVLASNMIFLGVVIFVPFSLGRVIIYYLSWILSSATNPVLSTVVPLSLANITLKTALTAVVNLTSDHQDHRMLGQVADVLKSNATGQTISNNISSTVATEILKVQSVGASRLSDVTTLAVGYIFVFSVVIFYLGIVTLIRYSRGEPLTMGRFYGIASIAETIPSLFRQFVAAMRHLMTMIKVGFLLVIELGAFPLMCGWWLDVCTIRMFGKSISQRVDFFSVSPLASSLVHWVVGIVYMLQISIFVSLLRGVLRNGVLYFLRDPADPNYNPFRDLIDDPVHKHARRVLLSVAVYGSLIVMLVFLPVKLAMKTLPSIFPLDISLSDPFTEIPADMLLFQICIPFAIEHFKLRHTLKSLLRHERVHGQGVGQEQVVALEDVNRPRYLAANANSAEELDDELTDTE
ncbi:hypothetical protein SASPL_115359 [Salvia splendens]|uniref:RING-type E3 ubiquitin transferase n=1 Tax=Salvia splendens TaxID=180675 RepID=A0A8X8Y868_SALSN|nr:hypothetical protein SASPL_115359 [Salvia splendens]